MALHKYPQRMKVILQETLQLGQQLWNNRPLTTELTRSIIHQAATSTRITTANPSSSSVINTMTTNNNINGPNSVAISLLRIEKEVNLFQYHGLQNYIKTKLSSSSLSFPSKSTFFSSSVLIGSKLTKNTDANDNVAVVNATTTVADSSQNSIGNKKARVAFMITAQQRHVLFHELQYSHSDIKSMKPLEALLIIEHSIHATSPENNATNQNNNIINYNNGDDMNNHVVNTNNVNKEYNWRERLKIVMEEYEKEISSSNNNVIDTMNSDSTIHTYDENTKSESSHFESQSDTVNDEGHESTLPSMNTYNNRVNNLLPSFQKEEYNIHSTPSSETAKINNDLEMSETNTHTVKNDNNNDILSIMESTQSISSSTTNYNNEWYEVVETHQSQDGSISSSEPVALYETLEEAEECITFKQSLVQKNNYYRISKPTYSIQKRII